MREQRRTRTHHVTHSPVIMFNTRGIEAIATITELRSRTSQLLEQAKKINTGILVQKNNEPYGVLISYERYIQLLNLEEKSKKKK